MKAFTIPTVFTAIDKFSGPVTKMAESMDKMERKVQAVGKNAAEIAKGSAIIGLAIAAPLAVAVNSAIKYEEELANLQALTGVAGAEFEKFKGKIEEVANASGKGFTETAQAFTAIANNQPELVKSAEALAAVTKATITLAKASKMELQPAGEALTQILNQFGLSAADADRAINILAAGSVAGSSEIIDSAEAIQKFGTVAANAGVKLNESIAMIELVSKFDKGAEAGTKLRNILIKMGNIKLLSKDAQKDLSKAEINMGIVSNTALPLGARLKEVSKILKVVGGVTHVFEAENQALATGLLTNVDSFGEYLSKVNTAGAANEMAATATNTLANRMQILQAKTDNISIALGEALMPMLTKLADKIIPILTGFTDWAKRNKRLLGTIIKAAAAIAVLSFAISAFSTIVLLVTKGVVAYNFVLGLLTAANILSSEAIWTNTVAMNGFVFAMKIGQLWTKAVTAATWLWNVALTANPIGLVIVGVLALGAALAYVESQYRSIMELHNKSLAKERASGFKTEAEQIKIATAAYVKYGKSQSEAQSLAIRDSKAYVNKDRNIVEKKMATTTDASESRVLALRMANLQGREKAIKAANPQKAQQNSLAHTIQTNNAAVDINIKDPNNRTTAKTYAPIVKVKTTSTMGAQK